MSLRVCLGCSTRYAVGLQSCPQCGTPTRNAVYEWEDDVAKANAEGNATFYVPEGLPVPDDIPDGVRLVGPGAPPEPPEPPAKPSGKPAAPEKATEPPEAAQKPAAKLPVAAGKV